MNYKRAAVIVTAVLIGLSLCIPAVAFNPFSYPPMPEALDALESTDEVSVEKVFVWEWFDVYYAFAPAGETPTKGFVFYPGGLVDARSYAPSARAIAARGYLTIIVSMPFDLAPFGSGRAAKIIEHYDTVTTWAVGGHSVGGTFACRYAKDFTDTVDGVVIWASYPSESFRLDDKDLKALLIYGTNNPNANADEIEENRPFLPADTVYVEIEGGNHTQFGFYDTSPEPVQRYDDIADITRQQQQEIIIEATVDFLDLL